MTEPIHKGKDLPPVWVIHAASGGDGETMERVLQYYTGTNFNRPQFTAMMEKVRHGEINLIIVKDFSRFSRDYKLTPRMLNELVEKIEVYNAEKIDGAWEQRLRIHYNCVGEITIPKMLPLPIPDVTVNKGPLLAGISRHTETFLLYHLLHRY